MSNIHGCYNEYIDMLKKIKFTSADTLYILGDIIDIGPHPIKVLLDVMQRKNVVFICGNHEAMTVECLKYWDKKTCVESVDTIDCEMIEKLRNWIENGGMSTIKEYNKCSEKTQYAIRGYIYNSILYK